jgi:alpha-1,2-mannosyltransferase
VAWLRGRRGLLILAIIIEIAAIWFVHWIHTRGYVDTQIYRLGAAAYLHGYPVYGDTLTPYISGSQTLPFIYPPFALLMFIPLAGMSVAGSIVTVAIVSHLSILISSFVLASTSLYLAPRANLVPVVTVLLMPFLTLIEPSRETLNFGQINLFLMALVLADCLLPRTKWPRGLLVGIAAGIKLTPLVFVVFFLLRRDFRATATALATLAATVAIGWIAAPADSAAWWFHKIFYTGSSFGVVYAGNLNLRSLLAKQGLTGIDLNAPWIAGSVILLVLAVFGMRYAMRVNNSPLALMLNAITGLLISPVSWSHHWVWAAPTLALLFMMAVRQRWYGILLMIGFCVLVVMIGPQWYLPYDNNLELTWTFSQQVVGNAYTVLGIGFLLGGAIAYFRFRPRRPSTSTPPQSELAQV